MKRSISIMSPAEKRVYDVFFAVIAVLFGICSYFTGFSPFSVISNSDQFWIFLAEDFFPPEIPVGSRLTIITDRRAGYDSHGNFIYHHCRYTCVFYGLVCQRAGVAVPQNG